MLTVVKERKKERVNYYGIAQDGTKYLLRLPGHNGEPCNLRPFRKKNKDSSEVFSCDLDLSSTDYKDPLTIFSNWSEIPEFNPNRVPFLAIDNQPVL